MTVHELDEMTDDEIAEWAVNAILEAKDFKTEVEKVVGLLLALARYRKTSIGYD